MTDCPSIWRRGRFDITPVSKEEQLMAKVFRENREREEGRRHVGDIRTENLVEASAKCWGGKGGGLNALTYEV